WFRSRLSAKTRPTASGSVLLMSAMSKDPFQPRKPSGGSRVHESLVFVEPRLLTGGVTDSSAFVLPPEHRVVERDVGPRGQCSEGYRGSLEPEVTPKLIDGLNRHAGAEMTDRVPFVSGTSDTREMTCDAVRVHPAVDVARPIRGDRVGSQKRWI